jgi:hypothetical protein
VDFFIFLIGKEGLIEQDNFLRLTQGEFMTKNLKIAAAILQRFRRLT